MPFYSKFGMNEENIIQYYDSWKKNRPDIIEDYAWFIFNYLITENAKQSDSLLDLYKRNESIYREMLSFRRKVEGKKANEIQKLYNKNQVELELQELSDSAVEYDFTIITPKNCKSCEHLTDKIITKQQAIKNDIIPYSDCERLGGCVCLICVIPKRNEEGRLIYK